MIPRNFLSDSEKRKRQIDTLKIFNDNVSEIKENAEYQIEFTAGKHKMYLAVVLCPEFPYEKPLLMIRPQVIHPWVGDNSNIIGAPGLINYTIHSDLGRVVQAIIREFEQKPPKLVDENDSETINSNQVSSPSFSVGSPIQPPPFPELQNLSIEELSDLKDCEDTFESFFDDLPATMELNKSVNDSISEIERLANENLSKQSVLNGLKEEMMIKIDTMTKLKDGYESLKSHHAKLCSAYSPHAIMAKLTDSTVSADEESEKIAESFLQGEIDCDLFLRNYNATRSSGHSRRACQEQFSHQLLQLDKAA